MEILLVDDKAENLHLLETFLQRNGYTTVTAANGAEALTNALKSPPDMVVSDILMPVMDGFVLCREWKKNKILQKIPFVFYTATYTDPKDEEFALSLGADRFIVKPQDLNDFLQIIKETYNIYRMKTAQPMSVPAPEEMVFLKEYNEALVRKLENKMVQIEAAEKELKKKNAALENDLEELKRAEEALVESERKYRQLVAGSPDGIFIIDLSGTFLSVNRAMCDILKYTEEEILSMKMWDIVLEQYRSLYEQRLVSIMNGESTNITAVYEVKGKDGVVHSVEVLSVPYYEGKEIVGYQGIARDITERLRTEKQIALLAHTLKSVAECVSITDTNDTVLFANNAFLKTYGYREEEILGKNVNVVRSTNNPPETARGILAATLAGGWSGELLNRTKDGHDFSVSLSTSCVRDEYGHVVALVGVATDITERKQSEEAKKRLEAHLQQAQKLESIGTLASGIAHDFNNILGIILGYSTLLERLREDPQKHSESVAAITKATQRGASFVKQLLIFARKTEALFETVSINDMIVEINKLLKETFPKTIIISTSLQPDLPTIVADASQIHQVFLNLCVNARDAMPKHGTLSISTRTVEGKAVSSRFSKATARQYVQIEVADTGIGMDEATRQRVFEPFFTTKGPGKGTGLGLAVVFGIMESHKGFVNVESEPGKGATFYLYFPVSQSVEIEQVKEEVQKEIPGGTETLLVVEDEELLRELLRTSLQSAGYTVLTAVDGQEAIDLFDQHRDDIQLVLSDIGLPKISGYDVFRKMKRTKPNLRFILASGFMELQLKSEIFKEGVKDFVQKPYSVYEVLQTVRTLLDQK